MGEKIKMIKDMDVEYLYVLKGFITSAEDMTPIKLERMLVALSYEFGEYLRFTPNDIFEEVLNVEKIVEDTKSKSLKNVDDYDEGCCKGCDNCTCKTME